MQAQAYLIWIMYKTQIGAVCLHLSGEKENVTNRGKKTGWRGEKRQKKWMWWQTWESKHVVKYI